MAVKQDVRKSLKPGEGSRPSKKGTGWKIKQITKNRIWDRQLGVAFTMPKTLLVKNTREKGVQKSRHGGKGGKEGRGVKKEADTKKFPFKIVRGEMSSWKGKNQGSPMQEGAIEGQADV